MPETVLIVDSEPLQLRMMELAVTQKLGYAAVAVSGCKEAVAYVLSGSPPEIDLALVAFNAAEEDLRTVRYLKTYRPQLTVLALVAYGDEEGAAGAVEAGACDFLTKPVALERLRLSLHNAFQLQRGPAQKLPDGVSLKETLALFDLQGHLKSLRSIENEMIRFTLRHCGGCMAQAARHLGIGRSTLYRRVEELGIEGYISRANQTMRPMMKALSIERS